MGPAGLQQNRENNRELESCRHKRIMPTEELKLPTEELESCRHNDVNRLSRDKYMVQKTEYEICRVN